MKRLRFYAFCCVLFCFMVSMSSAQQIGGKAGIGLFASGIKLVGDEPDHSNISYASGLSVKYSFSPTFTGEITAGLGWVRPRDPDSQFKILSGAGYKTYLYPWSLNLRINLFPRGRFVPFLGTGVGLTHWNLRDISEEDQWFPVPESGTSIYGRKTNFSALGVLGSTLFITENVGLELEIRYTHLFKQDLDNIGIGDANNGILEVRIGLGIYFGGFIDTDGDGIEDKYDIAPFQPEDFDDFQDEDGIPDPDNDEDGVPDEKDIAPNEPEDVDGFQDEDGVPDLDNDEDGIPDIRDACPDQPEDFDGFEDEDGCPDLDNDNDGIPDAKDGCPNQPETFNGFEDEDGCPDEKPSEYIPEEGQEIILIGVNFATGSADLTENAKRILYQVAESLIANEDIEIEIRGYTDSVGSASNNLSLSQRRAESVRNYLVQNGVTFSRLRAIGYGEANPIASNATPDGRAKNRRIEFYRIER